jgi:hypothetical protein
MTLNLSPAWASGSSVPELQFQEPGVVVVLAGQHIKFVPTHELSSQDALRLYPGQRGAGEEKRHGISLVATCPKASCYAYSEPAQRPCITLCSYPDLTIIAELEDEVCRPTSAPAAPAAPTTPAITYQPPHAQSSCIYPYNALQENSVIAYTGLAFSRSGERLASLAELPEPILSIWQVNG